MHTDYFKGLRVWVSFHAWQQFRERIDPTASKSFVEECLRKSTPVRGADRTRIEQIGLMPTLDRLNRSMLFEWQDRLTFAIRKYKATRVCVTTCFQYEPLDKREQAPIIITV
jgi:hypothetical protein